MIGKSEDEDLSFFSRSLALANRSSERILRTYWLRQDVENRSIGILLFVGCLLGMSLGEVRLQIRSGDPPPIRSSPLLEKRYRYLILKQALSLSCRSREVILVFS